MSIEKSRQEMTDYWNHLSKEPMYTKDGFAAIHRFSDKFESLTQPHRGYADQILGEWIVSEDGDARFCARFLISKFGIEACLPSLRELVRRLKKSSDVVERDEASLVEGLISKLEACRA